MLRARAWAASISIGEGGFNSTKVPDPETIELCPTLASERITATRRLPFVSTLTLRSYLQGFSVLLSPGAAQTVISRISPRALPSPPAARVVTVSLSQPLMRLKATP